MNNICKFSLSIFFIFILNGCGGGSSSDSTEDSSIKKLTVVENKDAITPPVLPLVTENPAISLN